MRFAVVAAFWLAFLVGGEVLAARREHGGDIPSPVVGCCAHPRRAHLRGHDHAGGPEPAGTCVRTPAVAWWGLGALVHAYAVRATGPLVVGLVALASWLVWQTTWDAPSALSVLLVLFAAGAVAASAAAWHEDLLPALRRSRGGRSGPC